MKANTRKLERTSPHTGLFTAALTLASLFISSTAFADFYRGWAPATKLLKADTTPVVGGCPIESPAGQFIFTARGGGADIWVNERTSVNGPFGPPAKLPAPVNVAEKDFCPTPVPDNGLYFVSERDGYCGDKTNTDIYVAVQNPATGWSEPVQLGCHPNGPNTPGAELSPSLVYTAWGTFLFYSTDGRDGNQDIYRSYQRPDGSFSKGVRLPHPINTPNDDRQPNVSQDGREMVFASDRDGGDFDIFYAKRFWLFGRWRRVTNLSETVPFDTAAAGETRPSLSWDGERLYYGSAGTIYISERD